MSTDTSPVVYDSARHTIVDFLHAGETHEAALLRLASYGTALNVLPYDEAAQRIHDAAKTDPVEITAEQWNEMLCVLPPVRWTKTAAGESFKLSERTTGLITGIYVIVADRYFTFQDSILLPHEDCCERVRGSRAFGEVEESLPGQLPDVDPVHTDHGTYEYPSEPGDR